MELSKIDAHSDSIFFDLSIKSPTNVEWIPASSTTSRSSTSSQFTVCSSSTSSLSSSSSYNDIRVGRTSSRFDEHRDRRCRSEDRNAQQHAPTKATDIPARRKPNIPPHFGRCASVPEAPQLSMYMRQYLSKKRDSSHLSWPERNTEEYSRGVGKLLDTDFDAGSFSDDDLAHLALKIFLRLQVDTKLGIPRRKLKRFIQSVRHHMLDNPYHNWTHVTDVLQAVYALGTKSGLLGRLSDIELLSLLIAALCHDLEHPGVSNLGIIRSSPVLSSLYDSSATLEKHHSLRALSLMMNEEVDLLSELEAELYVPLRDTVSRLIMATDMSRHADYSARIDEMIRHRESNTTSSKFFGDGKEEEDRQMEMEILIKLADTSNVLRPMPIAKRWALRVTDEFFEQGDLELSMGLTVSPQCNRDISTRVGLQISFLSCVIEPFYQRLARLYPAMAPALEQAGKNKEEWEGMTDDALLSEVRNSCGSSC